jgi:sec-independent protein translocase protein TatB
MDLLGIGPMELVFIVIIALIVLGPKDMAKAGRTIGKFMRDVVKSDTWKAIKTTTRELEHLPNRMMREAGLEDELKELNNFTRTVTAADLTRTIKPPTISPPESGSKTVSPEDAAFIPESPSDQSDSSDSLEPPTHSSS